MYIAAFRLDKRSCDCGELVEDIHTIDDPEKLQELEDCPEDRRRIGNYRFEEEAKGYLKVLYEDKMEINPESNGEAVRVRRYMYYRKSEMLLVPMPKALEALITK
jgi:hypothetical protein